MTPSTVKIFEQVMVINVVEKFISSWFYKMLSALKNLDWWTFAWNYSDCYNIDSVSDGLCGFGSLRQYVDSRSPEAKIIP